MLDTIFKTIENKKALLDADVQEVLNERIYLMPALSQAATLCWHLGSDWMDTMLELVHLTGSDYNVLHRVERLSWHMETAQIEAMVLIPHMLGDFNRFMYCDEDPAAQFTEGLSDTVLDAIHSHLPSPSDYELYAAALAMLLPVTTEQNIVPFEFAYTRLNRLLVSEVYDIHAVNSVLTDVLSFLEEAADELYRDTRYVNTLLTMILFEAGNTLVEQLQHESEMMAENLDDLFDEDDEEGICEDELDPWEMCDLTVTFLPDLPDHLCENAADNTGDLTEDAVDALLDELDEKTLEALPLLTAI